MRESVEPLSVEHPAAPVLRREWKLEGDRRITNCRACGAGDLTRGFEVREAGDEFRWLRCTSCGSLVLDLLPTVDDLSAVHGEGTYHGAGRRKFVRAIEGLVGGFRNARARWVARNTVPGGRILDVGCGRGQMVRALAGWGFQGAATEISYSAAQQVREVPAIEVRIGSEAIASWPPASFDAVCFFHTLEHMDDPRAALAHAYRLLDMDGQLFVEVPLLSPLARAFGARWFHLDCPRHLVQFTRQGLACAAARAGFRVAEQRSFSVEFSPASLFLSCWKCLFPTSNLYAHSQVTAPSAVRRVWSTVIILMGAGLFLVPAMLVAVLGQGDVLRARLIREDHAGGARS
jgi:SAM-dependent methyltransferase